MRRRAGANSVEGASSVTLKGEDAPSSVSSGEDAPSPPSPSPALGRGEPMRPIGDGIRASQQLQLHFAGLPSMVHTVGA